MSTWSRRPPRRRRRTRTASARGFQVAWDVFADPARVRARHREVSHERQQYFDSVSTGWSTRDVDRQCSGTAVRPVLAARRTPRGCRCASPARLPSFHGTVGPSLTACSAHRVDTDAAWSPRNRAASSLLRLSRAARPLRVFVGDHSVAKALRERGRVEAAEKIDHLVSPALPRPSASSTPSFTTISAYSGGNACSSTRPSSEPSGFCVTAGSTTRSSAAHPC
jgi:hypothetical protein